MFRRPPHIVAKLVRQKYKAEQNPPITRWNIVKGDKVQIIEGRDKGKQGVVSAVLRRRSSVLLTGLKMHTRIAPRTLAASGYVYKKESPIHYSNVQLVDPVSGKPTRVHRAILADGHVVRMANKSGAVIPKPENLKDLRRGKRIMNATSDTPADEVVAVTYVQPDLSVLKQWLEGKRKVAEEVAARANAEAEEKRIASKRISFHREKGRKVENRREVIKPKVLFTPEDKFPEGFIYLKKP